MQTKRKCSKGYSCGKSCISVKRVCRKELTGQSVDIADSLAELIKKASSPEAEKVVGFIPKPKLPSKGEAGEVDKSEKIIKVESKYNGTKLNSVARYSAMFDNWHVSFSVDGEYETSARVDLNKVDRVNITKLVRYDLERILEAVPEGATLKNIPNDEDGKGARRASIYKRFGFGDVQGKSQQAYKENGVIKPLNK